MKKSIENRNRETLRKLSIIALAMFGFGYALVPLYEKICEVTGINQLVKQDVVTNTQVDTTRTIIMEFDANVRGNIAWDLVPRERKRTIHPGELVRVVYDLRNTSDVSVEAQAIPSYGPQSAGQYVKKLACFCFTQQRIRAGESRELSVVLVVEPDIPADVHTVTLSYTMFEIDGTQERQSALKVRKGAG
jgi:cytochrome c oxidase assembly protein subunit 11